MWLQELKKYLGILVVGILLIVVYKTFDNFGYLIDGGRHLLSLLTPFIIGGFIAYVLAIPCRKLERLCQKTNVGFLVTHRRGIAVAAIYLLFLALIALLLLAIIPSLIQSVTQFMEQFPSLMQGSVDWFNGLGIYTIDRSVMQKLLNSQLLSLDNILGGFSFDHVNRYAKGVMNFGSTLFDIFLGLIVSVYLLLDRKNLRAIFARIANSCIAEKHRRILHRYLSKINEFVTRYISCQLVDAVIVFVLSLLALSIMRVEYAPLLALMVGAFNLIPYFGAIVATTLAGLITVFTKSFSAGVIVVVVLIVLQQIDANLIQPKILSGSLNIKPVWVILGIVLGGGLFGVLGIFLAVPCFALLRIIILDALDARDRTITLPAAQTAPEPEPPESEPPKNKS